MTEDQFEKLARLIKETAEETNEYIDNKIGALDEKFSTRMDAIDWKLVDITSAMKEGFAALHADIHSINMRLDKIETRLDIIDAHVASTKGYSVEIDELRSEIIAIKKHLGLTAAIAA